MSVETEIENLRDDVRGLRAAFDSFSKTFQGDVMSRLATLEQWKLSHQVDAARVEAKVNELETDVRHADQVPALVQDVVAIKAQNNRQEGSISALKTFGSLIAGLLVLAEIIHTVIAIAKGH